MGRGGTKRVACREDTGHSFDIFLCFPFLFFLFFLLLTLAGVASAGKLASLPSLALFLDR